MPLKKQTAGKKKKSTWRKKPEQSADYKQALKEYRKLAKRADQRLVRLEKLSNQEYYKGVKNYAYKRAQHDIKSWSGANATRFNTAPPEKLEQLKAKTRDIETFLNSQTSTKKDITKIYQKRTDTINKKYDTDFTWQDIADYYTSETHIKVEQHYGSDTEISAYARVKHKDKVSKIRESQKKRPKQDLIDKVVNQLNDYTDGEFRKL